MARVLFKLAAPMPLWQGSGLYDASYFIEDCKSPRSSKTEIVFFSFHAVGKNLKLPTAAAAAAARRRCRRGPPPHATVRCRSWHAAAAGRRLAATPVVEEALASPIVPAGSRRPEAVCGRPPPSPLRLAAAGHRCIWSFQLTSSTR